MPEGNRFAIKRRNREEWRKEAMKEQERKPWLLSFVSISRHGQQEGGGAPLFVEVWAFWFLDTESERERTVKDNVARTSTATRRVGCCPRGTSRIRSFLGSTLSTPLTLSSVHHVLFFLTYYFVSHSFSTILPQPSFLIENSFDLGFRQNRW